MAVYPEHNATSVYPDRRALPRPRRARRLPGEPVTRRTFVVCPVRDQPELSAAFLANTAAADLKPAPRVTILDNGSAAPTRAILAKQDKRRVETVNTAGLTIYEQWNLGFERCRRAARGRPFNVLITNNDVELPASAIRELAAALETRPDAGVSYPDHDWPMQHGAKVRGYRVTSGVLGDGGMIGACFMLAGDRLAWVTPEAGLVTDTGYVWWFGDNHLAQTISDAGLVQLRCVGLPLHHVNEATARHYPELERQKARDRQRWQNAQRTRGEGPARRARRHVPGTIVWAPGGRRRIE